MRSKIVDDRRIGVDVWRDSRERPELFKPVTDGQRLCPC